MVYRSKTGTRLSVSAQAAGELFAELESQGRLTPREVVEASRSEDAPLHDAFEWDDGVAAERYRESQASYLIRSIEVVIEGANSTTTRSFVSIAVSEGRREYHEIHRVLSIRDEREQLLEQAKRDLRAFKSKYATLEELAGVFAAIDSVGQL